MVVANPRDRKIWRIPGEYRETYLIDHYSSPYRRMVWAGIGLNFKSPLILINGTVNSVNYVKFLLDAGIFQILFEHYDSGRYLLQHDNAAARVSNYTFFFVQAKCEFSQKMACLLSRPISN